MSSANATMKPKAFFAEDLSTPELTFNGYAVSSQPDGTSIVHKVPVFKSGTFRDSMGDQMTWSPENLGAMCNHFNDLAAAKVFPDVPIRADHSESIDKVIGYISGLSTDGNMLYADQHITEPDALAKMKRGTYRSVSAEVGMYVDNADNYYWPVLQGVAYVPMPAVEGLHSKATTTKYFMKEKTVAHENSGTPPDVGAPKVDPPANHAAPVPVVHKFTIGGTETVDYAAVQRHISTLEGFQVDTIKQGRSNFVAALATEGKITAPQVESLTGMALSLNDAQFEAFKASYALAPKMSLLSQHGSQDPNRVPGEVDPKADDIEVQKGIIAMHQRAGMKDDDLHNTRAYKHLADLTAAKN